MFAILLFHHCGHTIASPSRKGSAIYECAGKVYHPKKHGRRSLPSPFCCSWATAPVSYVVGGVGYLFLSRFSLSFLFFLRNKWLFRPNNIAKLNSSLLRGQNKEYEFKGNFPHNPPYLIRLIGGVNFRATQIPWIPTMDYEVVDKKLSLGPH